MMYRFMRVVDFLKDMYNSIEYEGQLFKVTINLEQNKVSWREVYEETR
jgi:hypothetical protein